MQIILQSKIKRLDSCDSGGSEVVSSPPVQVFGSDHLCVNIQFGFKTAFTMSACSSILVRNSFNVFESVLVSKQRFRSPTPSHLLHLIYRCNSGPQCWNNVWHVKLSLQGRQRLQSEQRRSYQTPEGSRRKVFHRRLKCSLHRTWETICRRNQRMAVWDQITASRSSTMVWWTHWWNGITGSRAGLGAVPRAPSGRHRTVHPEPRKGGSNWAMSPCSRYRSPADVELSNIWLALQRANNEPEGMDRDDEWESFFSWHLITSRDAFLYRLTGKKKYVNLLKLTVLIFS